MQTSTSHHFIEYLWPRFNAMQGLKCSDFDRQLRSQMTKTSSRSIVPNFSILVTFQTRVYFTSASERSFSKKKLAVLTDPQFGGKNLALVDEKVWFPYILGSGAFTTVVPKSLLKKLKKDGSGVVETTLKKDVEMKTAVKDVVTIANSMIHITI